MREEMLRPPAIRLGVAVSLLLLLFPHGPYPASGGGFPAILTLERAFPVGGGLEGLRARDRIRHGRLLQASYASSGAATTIPGVVDFPVQGSSDPFTVGLYFTRVKLGNPPKEFYVQIDTGSDILWVTCSSCSGCPGSSGLNIRLEFFDPDRSATASLISCADERCSSALQTEEGLCTSSLSVNSLCGYTFQYGDGSGTSGYYVSDTLYFDMVFGNEQTANSSATVVFGCSNSQSGDLTKPDRAVDGIFGFGQHGLSVISQLSSLGMAPKAFSHCLKGSDGGGGILVLGEIVEPGIVYSPLVQAQTHYNLNLESIAVNGQILPIDSSAFSTSPTQGTIVDSGTTLAYLAEAAYYPFVNAITASVSQLVQSYVYKGNQCFATSSSVDGLFPTVTLNFAGGAAMNLKPQDYLLQQGSVDSSIIWCIGWQRNPSQGITILGDIVLKDKIFVYDLAGQRLGWANYDCSLPVNVSTSSGRAEFNTGQLSVSDSTSRNGFYDLMLTVVADVLVHIFMFSIVYL